MGTVRVMGEEMRVCSVDEVRPGTARRFDIGSHRIAVVRVEDDFYVIGDTCSHQAYSLSEGLVDEDDCLIECPKHGSEFDLVTGAPRSLPATKPVPTYEVRVDGGDVLVTVP